MKLSELQQVCKNLAKMASDDAEVVFRHDGNFLELKSATMEGVTEVSMTRGDLKPSPRWNNKVVLWLEDVDGSG